MLIEDLFNSMDIICVLCCEYQFRLVFLYQGFSELVFNVVDY